MRSGLFSFCLGLVCSTAAMAGPAYTPPPLTAGAPVEVPAALRADATALLEAVRAHDAEAAGTWLAAKITVISGGLDIALPRSHEVMATGSKPAAMVSELGQYTGGDWDVPEGADLGKVLLDAEVQFVEQSLTDGQPWGSDPLVKGAICSYGAMTFDIKAVKKLAKDLGVAGSSLYFVTRPLPVKAAPDLGAATVATLEPGQLYAFDYDTSAPGRWMALHLPEGGTGFTVLSDGAFDRPYTSGLCFGKQPDGHWRVVAQTSTGL